jgi:hypothetical protein
MTDPSFLGTRRVPGGKVMSTELGGYKLCSPKVGRLLAGSSLRSLGLFTLALPVPRSSHCLGLRALRPTSKGGILERPEGYPFPWVV